MNVYYLWTILGCLCFGQHGCLKVERTVRQVQARQTGEGSLKIVLLGETVSFDCSVESSDVTEVSIWWQKDEVNLTTSDTLKYAIEVSKTSEGVVSSELTVYSVQWQDDGVYSCRARDGEEGRIEKEKTTIAVQAKPINVATEHGEGNITQSMELSCEFEGKPVPEVSWLRQGTTIVEDPNKYEITESQVSDNTVKSLLKIMNLNHGDNSTYLCYGKNVHNSDTAIVDGFVFDSPSVEIDQIVAVSSTKLFINWTVNSWNQPVTGYIISYREGDTDSWKYHMITEIDGTNYIMANLTADKEYAIKLAAKNAHGTGEFDSYETEVKTLNFDPVFVPEVEIKGKNRNSITVGWDDPPEIMKEHIHYYKVTKYEGEKISEIIHTMPFPLHLWEGLEPATSYNFTVSACNKYSRECAPPSQIKTGVTYDGLAGAPAGVQMSCKSDNISVFNWVDVKWLRPKIPNGKVEFYNVELTGRARYNDENRKLTVINVDATSRTVDSTSMMIRFDFLEANTNYSVRVCAVTGSQECGDWKTASCTMPVRPPSGLLGVFSWYSVKKDDKNIFKLSIPRLSERNGAICCIKVIVVRLGAGQTADDLPLQREIPITNYQTAHLMEKSGAYVAEIISNVYMGREIEIGDGKSIDALGVYRCPSCFPYGRDKRFTDPEPPGSNRVQDGFLDDSYNYTAFVEVVIEGGAVGRSEYLQARKPGDPEVTPYPSPNTVLVTVLGVLAGLVLVAIILMIVLFMLRRYSKQVAAQQGVEMDLKHTFRHFCSTIKGRGHSQFLLTQDALTPPDLPPIDKKGMVGAYLERHKDSDYGFQAEFESLPEKFTDRTTLACDLPCNKPKNRYPDIKSYDQTRVKLSVSEEVEGADVSYINANFVVGYKERKRWICAQGPLESTLADFWRMIQEQGVEIVIMLTNLEEYNRVKCAQYWPGAGTSTFGAITVAFVQEKRYSDYVVRELKMSVEGSSVSRSISHYHYLQWKDFNAPEHAPAMLKFVKRINEAWSGSSPILVHCSAGVGRSGSLIAIDSLTQTMEEEGGVSIFQTVSDLRRQRNYLVQSVKQYQFVYRAIMEFSQFGDTEMDAAKIKEHWVGLAQDEGLNEEFSRLANVVDDRKALSVATNAENKSKNGSDSVIPYDRNRVILTPDGARPHSTYINASFIEGYYNDESFIITQDPLEDTAMDFWRMVVEHNVATMVMLTGQESAGWQYWPQDEGDRTLNFGCMTVTLVSRESRVSYVKREFQVCNVKSREEVNLTHFFYAEWPGNGDDQAVPSSTHGLLGLVEHALAHQEEDSLTGPIAVHCRYGSDRSSIYVTLSVLVQQIKREGRCDVFTAVRKLRAQRQGMIQHLSLYEFVYRAISDYVDLYRNKDEEYEYSVPIGTVTNNGTTKSAKSIQSAKSNGSGPYCMPVGSNGTTKSSSGSQGSGTLS